MAMRMRSLLAGVLVGAASREAGTELFGSDIFYPGR
ncbi:unnamed protein product (plasmid) [Mycetohabitans rhizoxinica HKI 454]|uniref:Uncharacterized protein n=1 Tax=Mycetohabitans rhizoxinica (strain DSM 19002 / CIP 109453 / HKI 454) TaxID=882378 RepID=E5AVZ8_MYCRK|nr:unnamed protein product [Mycetohabitans rhizoxinica HKI 454]